MQSRGETTSTGLPVRPPNPASLKLGRRPIWAMLQIARPLLDLWNACAKQKVIAGERNPATYQEFPSVLLPFFSAKR